MNDTGNRYAIHALRERRAALDGELRQCEQRLRHLREMLGHLDATLSLFDPDGNPKAIKGSAPISASSCSERQAQPIDP
jgi:hypothetical protein